MVEGHVLFLFASPDVLPGGVILIGHNLFLTLLTGVTLLVGWMINSEDGDNTDD